MPLEVLIPERIRRQLGIKTAEEGRSLRELVLRALPSIGIDVTDQEIGGQARPEGEAGSKECMIS